jgi:hypothetical protein
MTDTTEEAERLFKQLQPSETLSSYEIEQRRIRHDLERLKAERLAREAGGKHP